MKLYRWNEVEKEQLNPLLARQAVHGANITVARIHLAKGCVVPRHSHANEQISMVERGRLRFVIDGQEVVVEGGQMVEIHPNAPHEVEALEDSLVTDLFSPAREDWQKGDDAYLRR